MSYCILDKCGNFIAEYKTITEIEKAFNVKNGFSRCSQSISKLIQGQKPRVKVLSVNNVVCVKKDDYVKYLDKIIWVLTREDVLIINKDGDVEGTYKNASLAIKSLNPNASRSSANKILNEVNKDYMGYRFVTREHYIKMIKDDPLYYSKEYIRPDKKKKPVDMYNFKTGKFIKSFKSHTEAANYMGCSLELIVQAIKHGGPILKTNYCFVLAEKEEGENNG